MDGSIALSAGDRKVLLRAVLRVTTFSTFVREFSPF